MEKVNRFPSNRQGSGEGRSGEPAVGHESESFQTSYFTTMVFIIDDELVPESLELLLRSAVWQPTTFASVQEFLDRSRTAVPCCLVSLPGLDDQQLLNGIPVERTDLPIVFIPAWGDVPKRLQAMERGGVEFLTKPFKAEVFLTALRRALERSRLALIHETEMKELQDRYASLSPRERQVMELLFSGLLNKQVGGELGISEHTVKVHRGRLMRKMQANSFAHLVRMAARLHLTALPWGVQRVLVKPREP